MLDRGAPIYPYNLYFISWFDSIHVVVIGDHPDGRRSLPCGYVVGQLLKLNVLLVSEFAEVVHNAESTTFSTSSTYLGLLNSRILEDDTDTGSTLAALEVGTFHLGVVF